MNRADDARSSIPTVSLGIIATLGCEGEWQKQSRAAQRSTVEEYERLKRGTALRPQHRTVDIEVQPTRPC